MSFLDNGNIGLIRPRDDFLGPNNGPNNGKRNLETHYFSHYSVLENHPYVGLVQYSHGLESSLVQYYSRIEIKLEASQLLEKRNRLSV
jgi:hypothetical protein